MHVFGLKPMTDPLHLVRFGHSSGTGANFQMVLFYANLVNPPLFPLPFPNFYVYI